MSGRTIGAVTYDLRASGVVRNLLRIAASARRAGLDVEVWPLRAQGEFASEAREIAPVRPLLDGPAPRQRDLDSLLHQRALARAMAKRAPGLVFSAGNQMHWHLARALRLIPTGQRPRTLARASNAVVTMGETHPLLRPAIRRAEAFQYGAMDHVVAVSHELRGQIVDGLGIAGGRVSVIPNGIDVDRFAAADAPRPVGTRPVILGIGRLSVQKDFATLIDAVAMLDIDPKPTLRILGRGSEAWRAKLTARAAKRGMADRLELAGHVADVAGELGAADLFVSSSRWEGASNVVLEALACGTPIVATRAPTGIEEVLRPLGEDLLVPMRDPAALARAIKRRLARPRGAQALIARARDYDLARTLARYDRLLAERLNA